MNKILVENSCKSEIRDSIEEVHSKLTSYQKGGMTYFKLTMEAIVMTIEEAVNNMQDLRKATTLNKIKYETVRVLASQMRESITWLENLNPIRVPYSIYDLALNNICAGLRKNIFGCLPMNEVYEKEKEISNDLHRKYSN